MPHPLSIIIPTFNQSDYTIRCIRSLRHHTTMPYDIIWIDNGSTDAEHQAVLSTIMDMRHKMERHPQPLGFPKAINRGLALAEGQYIVMLNNDVEVMPGWDTELRDALLKCAGASGPVAIQPAGWQAIQYHSWLGVQKEWPAAMIHQHLRNNWSGKFKEVPFYPLPQGWRNILAFFCTMFNREVFQKVGVLDESFKMGMGDDNDFCYRMRQAGYKLFLCPGALVKHAVSATMSQIPGGTENLMKNARRILIKKYGRQRSRFI